MKEEKKGVFTIVNDKGEEVECEILFTFDSDETKKSYIVYTDNTLDEEGSTKVYASVYDPTGQNPALTLAAATECFHKIEQKINIEKDRQKIYQQYIKQRKDNRIIVE